ncbi:hypothetical protein [Usitatibacter palustris]|uniref:Uncharacterized protein n=1 Tax=Usitatibacter palustris TaxID=2732487 RepID=A0A6M4HB22_9PROT|nr:hypothetical protein [Usitatibacter palustris]QJR16786.1 hypothetical protein DSM104440_03622 [Usitatibacter palustris]
MNAVQTLDRTSVVTLALVVASLMVAWVVNQPAGTTKQVSAPQATVAAIESPYKVVVTAQRLPQRIATLTVHASRSL